MEPSRVTPAKEGLAKAWRDVLRTPAESLLTTTRREALRSGALRLGGVSN